MAHCMLCCSCVYKLWYIVCRVVNVFINGGSLYAVCVNYVTLFAMLLMCV